MEAAQSNFHILRETAKRHVRRRDVFAHRDFRTAMLGQSSSQIADAMNSFGLAQVLLFELNPGDTAQAFLRGLVIAAFPLLLVGPVAGLLADRVARQRLLVGGQLVRAALTLGAIVAAVAQQQWIGYTTFGLLLLATRVLYTVRSVVIPRLVPADELVAADSMSLVIGTFSGLAGVVAAAAIEWFDVRGVFVAAVVLHVLSSRAYARLRVELGGGRATGDRRDWRGALAQLRIGKVRHCIVSSGAGKLLLGVCYACIALVVDARFDVEATGYAVVFGVAGAGTFLGTLTAERVIERIHRASVSVLAAAVSAVVLAAVLVVDHYAAAIAAVAVAAFAFQNVRVCNDAAVQSSVASSSLGRVFAAYDVAYNLSFVAGAAAALALGAETGYGIVIGACCAGYAALAAALVLMGSGDPRPTPITVNPQPVHAAASSTLRVSNTSLPVIAAATPDGSTVANSGHSVSTASASAPNAAPSDVYA